MVAALSLLEVSTVSIVLEAVVSSPSPPLSSSTAGFSSSFCFLDSGWSPEQSSEGASRFSPDDGCSSSLEADVVSSLAAAAEGSDFESTSDEAASSVASVSSFGGVATSAGAVVVVSSVLVVPVGEVSVVSSFD